MTEPLWNFEQEPGHERGDETDVNLRAYLDLMPDEKMREYRKDWSDDRVMEWDGNFRDEEGTLLIPPSERDVSVHEYRAVLEACIRYRDRVRGSLAVR